jgi:AsmA protein
MKAVKIVGSAVAAVVVVAALLLVVGIPSGFLTTAIQERVERETGYRLTIAGSTKIGLWPSLNVTMSDLTLEGPKDRDDSNRLTIGSVQADMRLASVWSGHPEITELAINRPLLNVPLLRERKLVAKAPAAATHAPSSGAANSDAPVIGRITITDGSVIFSNLHDRVENRLEAINASATVSGDRKVRVNGNARAAGNPVKFDIKASVPPPPLERQNVPVEVMLEAPFLQSPLSSRAEVRLNGSLIMINGLSGAIGDGAFNGWASVDIASKPLVKVDLDFQRLDIATSKAAGNLRDAQSAQQPQSSQSQSQPNSQAWSPTTIDLNGLNYVDAQVRLSAAELNTGQAHFAPVAIDASLSSGLLKCALSNVGAYGGQANGEIDIDASGATPAYAMRSDLVGVRGLPLLRGIAGFDKLDGKLQAKITVRSTGQSQRAIMANLNGTAFANFQDGAIQGLNLAQMIRALTTSPLSGWQERQQLTTDLTQLSASFRIDRGQATTSDLNLVGPLVRMTGAGTVDLPTKMLAFRVEPKLVMTTEGQGRASDPVGLGIPVIIDGPWAEPRIYPDVAGVLDNPDAAYAKLKELGKGLFGQGGLAELGSGSGSGGGLSDMLGGKLGETLGNLLQQGLGQGGNQGRSSSRGLAPPPADPSPAPSPPAQNDPSAQGQQESQPMKDVLRQLFNR